MTTKLVTAPTESPVSLDELKAHIQNTQPDEDADLSRKLDAATVFVREELSRPIITSTWDVYLESWPSPYVHLLFNTQSVTSVKYTDTGGAEHTVDASTYKLDRTYDPAMGGDSDSGAARLHLASGKSWPSASLDVGESIVIRLVAGWKDAASVPVPIKQAILMIASHFYRNRNAIVAERGVVPVEIALGVSRLLSVYEDRRN